MLSFVLLQEDVQPKQTRNANVFCKKMTDLKIYFDNNDHCMFQVLQHFIGTLFDKDELYDFMFMLML